MPYRAISIFVMFALGQFLQIWQRAAEAVGSKYNGISSLDQYFQLRAQEIAGRFFLISCLFGGWESGGLYPFVGYLNTTAGAALAAHRIPVVWWTAGVLGYCGDAVLYFAVSMVARVWPGIRSEVPPPIPVTAPEVKEVVGGVVVLKKHE